MHSRLFLFMLLLVSFVCLGTLTSCTQVTPSAQLTSRQNPGVSSIITHTKQQQIAHEVLTLLVDGLPVGKSVAFVGLENLQGEKTELSRNVFYALEPQLLEICRERNIQLVEREDLKAVMDEWLLEMSGFTTKDEGARELLGADIILMGKVAVDSDRVNVYLKMMSLENGILLGSGTVSQEADFYGGASVAREANGHNLSEVKQIKGNRSKSDDNKIRIWTEKESYRIGEPLVVFFEVDEASYVTIVDITPDGEKKVIFPNPYMQNNYCEPGVTYQLPPPNAAFGMDVTGPVGRDRIIVMTGNEPEIDSSVMRTRGIKFTQKIVKSSTSRAGIVIDIE